MAFLHTTLEFSPETGIPAEDNSMEFIQVDNPFSEDNPDPTFMVQEVVRVLKKGGNASFGLFGSNQKDFLVDTLQAVMNMESATEIEGSSSAIEIFMTKAVDDAPKLEYISKAWDGIKTRYSDQELENAVPKAILQYAKQQENYQPHKDLKFPFKEPTGEVNIVGIQKSLEALDDINQINNLPSNIVNSSRAELERLLKAYEAKQYESHTSEDTDLTDQAKEELFKCADFAPEGFLKSKDEERLVYYAVHTPYKLDADGHYFTYDALEKCCERFENIKQNIDTSHDYQFYTEDEVEVVANFIAKGDEVYIGYDETEVSPIKGQWILGFYCKSDEVWEKVKDGTYSGVSMAGQGLFVDGIEEELINYDE